MHPQIIASPVPVGQHLSQKEETDVTDGQYRNMMTLVVVVALVFFGLFLVSQDANARRMTAIEARLGMGTPNPAQEQTISAGALLDQIQARGGLMGLIFGSEGWVFEARPLAPITGTNALGAAHIIAAPMQTAPVRATATPKPVKEEFDVLFVDSKGFVIPNLDVTASWIGKDGLCYPIDNMPKTASDNCGLAHITILNGAGNYAVNGENAHWAGGAVLRHGGVTRVEVKSKEPPRWDLVVKVQDEAGNPVIQANIVWAWRGGDGAWHPIRDVTLDPTDAYGTHAYSVWDWNASKGGDYMFAAYKDGLAGSWSGRWQATNVVVITVYPVATPTPAPLGWPRG